LYGEKYFSYNVKAFGLKKGKLTDVTPSNEGLHFIKHLAIIIKRNEKNHLKIPRRAVKAVQYLLSQSLTLQTFRLVIHEDPYAEDDFLSIHTKVLNAHDVFTKLLEKLKLSDGCINNTFDQSVKEEASRRHGLSWKRRKSTWEIFSMVSTMIANIPAAIPCLASERDTSPRDSYINPLAVDGELGPERVYEVRRAMN